MMLRGFFGRVDAVITGTEFCAIILIGIPTDPYLQNWYLE